jgi:hypothetical protein
VGVTGAVPGGVGGVVTGGAGGGRNALTLAPPIDALLPPAAITTGADASVQYSSVVVGSRATFRPWSSLHAIERPSWESETSLAMPAAGR